MKYSFAVRPLSLFKCRDDYYVPFLPQLRRLSGESTPDSSEAKTSLIIELMRKAQAERAEAVFALRVVWCIAYSSPL